MAGMDQADNKQSELDDAIKQIRDRTFNPELRSLVSKITGESESQPLSKTELLRELRKLFYRAENIASYTEDALAVIDEFNDREASITPEEFNEKLKANGCLGFTLLCFNSEAMAYSDVLNFLPNKEPVFIGLHDPIVSKIGRNPNGMFLAAADAMNLLASCGANRIFSLPLSSGGHPSVIFLLLCKRETELAKIATFIAEEANPFVCLSDYIVYPDYSLTCGEPAASFLDKTELFFQMAANKGGDTGVFFSLKRTGSYDDILQRRFMLAALYAYLQKKLKGYAFFCRLRQDRFAVILRHDSISALNEAVLRHCEAAAADEQFYEREDISIEQAGGISLWLRKVFL